MIRKIRAPTKIVCEIVLDNNSSKIYNRGTLCMEHSKHI